MDRGSVHDVEKAWLRDTPPSMIPVPVPSDHPFLTPNTPPVWFSGTPFTHLNNPLLVPILNAPSESFASDTDSDSGAEVLFEAAERGGEGLWAGRSLGIVTGFQTHDNSARVTWVGGVELFSDEYAKKSLPSCVNPSSRYCNVSNIYSFFFLSGENSGNGQFALDIATWTFQGSLVLRIDSTTHHLVNETTPREHYTINENIVRHSQLMN
jgi:oligosaccharyltransferase complex subunit beta